MKSRSFLTILAAVVAVGVTFFATNAKAVDLAVMMTVDGDELIKGTITQYFKTAIKAIPGIQLADEKDAKNPPDVLFMVNALSMADPDSNVTYYSISTDVISNDEWVISLLTKGLSMQEATKLVAAGHPTLLYGHVILCRADRMESVIGKAVALLDKAAVEPLRAKVEAFTKTK